jgi:hypothetical protein
MKKFWTAIWKRPFLRLFIVGSLGLLPFVSLFQNCSKGFRTLESTDLSSVVGQGDPFEILFHPLDQSAYVGETVFLQVTAVSVQEASFQWYKDGEPIPDATASKLSLSNVKASHAGRYSVVVKASGQELRSEAAEVRIQNPPPMDIAPMIQMQPQPITANAGDAFQLRVQASGYPSPTYRWFKDTLEIPGQTSNSLQVLSALVSDAGRYSVKASNRLSTADSLAVDVRVTEVLTDVAITSPLKALTKSEGDTLTQGQFCVTARGGGLRYSWKKGGTAIAGTSSCLLISVLSAADAGTYEVTVSNNLGSQRSSANLTVNVKQIAPMITMAPQATAVLVGSNHTFTVTAVGNPAPTYQWIKDGSNLNGKTAASLLLSNIQMTDAGLYSVRVSNSLGLTTSTPAQLGVQASEVAPVITAQLPPTLSVIVGTGVTEGMFCVTVTGANLTYAWKKQGASTPAPYNANKRCYTVPVFDASDAGNYEVKVSNSLGSVTSVGALTIGRPACIISLLGVAIGQGTRPWLGASYGDCQASSCNTGYHIELNTCLPNQKSCPVSNGMGQTTWNGSSYGDCVITSCNTGYVNSNGMCVQASSLSVFSNSIKPIVENKCLVCHRPGGLSAPMTSSQSFASRSYTINQKLNHLGPLPYMPPWYVDNSGSCGNFRLDHGLSSADKSTILGWLNNPSLVSNGVPVGVENNVPLTPPATISFGDDPAVKTSTMPQTYTMPNVSDEYRCFILPAPTTMDQYVVGYEMVAGNQALVHHAILGYAPTVEAENNAMALDNADPNVPGYQCFGDLGEATHLFIWAPGRNALMFPPGTGIKINGNRKLILQIHYNRNNATNYSDKSSVRLKFASSVTAPAKWLMIGGLDGAIPAGRPNYAFSSTMTAEAMTVYGSFPHMHLYGKSIKTEIVSPTNKCMINIPAYDFHFQLSYFYNDPVQIRAGDSLRTTCVYDTTSTAAPVQPGFNSNEEMCLNFLYVSSTPATQRFTVQKTADSGPLSAKNMNARVVLDSLHKNLKATVFVQAKFGSTTYYLKSTSPNLWVPSTGTEPHAHYQYLSSAPDYVDISLYQGFDLTPFTGTKVSIGYGIGETADAAFTEMNANSRMTEFYVVP